MQRVRHANRERLLLRTPGPVPFGTCIFSTCWDQRYPISIRHYTSLWHYLPGLTFLLNPTFHQILVFIEHRNGCDMPTGDAYSSGHLVLSHFGTCMCSNVETKSLLNLSCLQTLKFEHPSVLLFCSGLNQLKFCEIFIFYCIVSVEKWTQTVIWTTWKGV